METGWLYELIYNISPYTPLVVFVAATVDIFFLTGFIFYGAAMLSMVLMFLAANAISIEALVASAFLGTVFGNTLNYWTGRWFGESAIVRNKLQHPRLQNIEHTIRRRGLLLFMTVGRFITFTRPIYALVLGSIQTSFRRFMIRELPLALVWVSFWLFVILKSGSVLRELLQ